MKVGSLFSGIGGFDLAARWAGMTTEWMVEKDEYCQRVLRKHWPDTPIYGDINDLDATVLAPVDLICGGYPCQPFSLAGRRKGKDDDRHLWPRMFEIITQLRTAWVLGENVAGHISMGLDSVLSDLEGAGYSCQAFVVPACAVDAPHRRDRVWIVAHSCCDIWDKRGSEPKGQQRETWSPGTSDALAHDDRTLLPQPTDEVRAGRNSADHGGKPLAHSHRVRELQPQGGEREQRGWTSHRRQNGPHSDLPRSAQRTGENTGRTGENGWTLTSRACLWAVEPGVGRVAHGVPKRVDRLKCLGNAVVPQVAYMFLSAIAALQKARGEE